MEEKDIKNNNEEKQNLEEEEFDEEDEEEKEQEQDQDKDKEDSKNEAKESQEENNENTNKQNDNSNKPKDEPKQEQDQNQNKENINNIDISSPKEIISEKNEKIEEPEKNEQISEKKEEKEEKIQKIEEKNEEINNKNEENKLNEEKQINDKKEEENENKKNEEEEEEEEKEEEIKEGASTYILKYSRKNNEPRESAYDKELIKAKHCLFMIEFKLLKGKKNKYLLIYCHEIAAIYFDEIYKKKYTIKDLYKENRHFRIFDDVEDAKNIIDEILNNNTSNSKKIFIEIQENTFKLHLKMIFFDKECEIIFNIPKKNINDKERIRLLPGFLKEIQIRMNRLEDENKKLKIENKNMNENDFFDTNNKNNGNDDEDNEFFGEKDEMNNSSKKNKSVSGRGYKKKLIKK